MPWFRPPARIRRAKDGSFTVGLSDDERSLLGHLVPQLQALLDDDPDQPALRRLFPRAYVGDDEAEAEYRSMVGDDLRARVDGALTILAETADAESLSEDQLLGWMSALNQLRLVLGTRLDIGDDDDGPTDPSHPDAHAWAVYHYLTGLMGEVVHALQT